MPKEFYTERDIEDMWKRGIMSLQITDNVVLTELAYEKAQKLGLKLLKDKPIEPPAAPVRPYLSQGPVYQAASTPASAPAPSMPPAAVPQQDVAARIRTAVLSRMAGQVDPALLESIIQRVLKSTGVK